MAHNETGGFKDWLMVSPSLLFVGLVLFFGSSQFLPVFAITPFTQIEGLEFLFNSTNGTNWKWNNEALNGPIWSFSDPQADPCNDNNQVWQGITCSSPPSICRTQDCEIVSLTLDAYGLDGSLPVEFFTRVTSLETFYITSCQKLSGSIPSELSSLSGLKFLSLALNRLTGTLPPELSSLSFLNFCSLYSNKLTGSIPPEYGELSQLNSLSLDDNELTGSIPSEFGSLSQLISIYLYSNHITGSIPSQLGSLSLLNSLSLHSNQLTGPIPSELSSFRQMSALNLYSNHLTGSIPPELSSLTKLNYFYLNTNDLTGSIPPEFGSFSQLLYLSLYRNHLTGPIPSEFGSFSQLSVLYLHSNNLTGSIPPEFGSISQLDLLYLSSNRLTGFLPTALYSLTRLSVLSLDTNQLSGSILPEVGLLTRLSLLSLSFNRFTGILPSEFGSLFRMTSLSLDFNQFHGTIPPEFSSMSLLAYFSFFSNQLTGTLPSQLSSLSRLNFLYCDSNQLTGSIPPWLTSLAQLSYLSISNNKFRGLIPSELSSLSQLTVLSLAFNSLTGPIPSELSSLSRLNYLSLSVNRLTGTIPSELSLLSRLTEMYLYVNLLTGFIPSELSSLTRLNYLILEDNQLSGPIPSQLNSLAQLKSFSLSWNQLTGSIPPSLLNLFVKLWSLDLSLNSLTGPIPSEIGLLTSLEILDLSQNYLSGSFPSSIIHVTNLYLFISFQNNLNGEIDFQLDSFPNLQQLFLQQNAFHGNLNKLFSPSSSPSSHLPLINLDFSDNRLTGSIPSELFYLSQLKTISLSLNCFQHELPSSLCQAGGVHAMSMSGLGSSSHCHNIVKVPFTSVSLVQTMDGSIPNCVWLLSNLKSLDLAGNGLSGTIGEMAAMSSLASLTLSHNYLTGVIPTWLQEKELNQLDLSHNKLTGALDDFKQKNDQEITSLKSLKLSVNRLSGNLFRSLGRYSTLDILSGNLFSCGYIPTNDKNSAWTICGSEELDQSLMVMGGVCSVILLLLCFYGFCFFFFTLFFKNSTTTTLHQTHGNLEITADNTQQPLGKVFLWFQGRFLDSQTLILYTNYFSLDSLPILNHQTCASIVSFGLFLSNLNRSLCLLTLLSLFLSLPIYLLKVIDVESQDGDETNDNQTQYITHTHMYRWLWTMTFISGALPSIFLLTVTLLCLMTFCFIINLLGKSMSIEDITHQDEAVRSSNSCSSTPLPLSQSQTNEEDIKLEDDNKQGQGHVGFHMSAAVWLVLMINITVVGAVNGLYLWSTLLDLSNHVRILIQFSFGLFTLAWRVLIINRGLPSQMKESCHGVWLLTCLNAVNNVLIPCVVTALSNPSCYQRLLVPPDDFTSSYSYQECVVYYIGLKGYTCVYENEVLMAPLKITPPFSYSYQCGSTLLVSYIPVYMYSVSLQLVSIFIKFLVTISTSLDLPEVWLKTWLSPIAWPLQSIHKLTSLSRSNPSFISSMKLINAYQIVSNVVNNIILLLSFGLCSPVLSCYITLSIGVSLTNWLMLIGRFVFYRHDDHSSMTRMSVNSTTLNDLHEVHEEKVKDDPPNQNINSLFSQDPLPIIVPNDAFLDRLNDQLRDVNSSLIVCKWPVIFTSCLFVTLLCWEMVGDEVGWERGSWVAAVGVGILFVVWIWDRFLVSRVINLLFSITLQDIPSPLIVSSHSTELVRSSLR